MSGINYSNRLNRCFLNDRSVMARNMNSILVLQNEKEKRDKAKVISGIMLFIYIGPTKISTPFFLLEGHHCSWGRLALKGPLQFIINRSILDQNYMNHWFPNQMIL